MGNPCNSAEPTPISMAPRRFPPPWSVEDNGAAFIVKDYGGQTLAYVCYEDEPRRRAAVDLHAQFNVQCRREGNRDRSPRRQTHTPVSPFLAGVFLWPTAGLKPPITAGLYSDRRDSGDKSGNHCTGALALEWSPTPGLPLAAAVGADVAFLPRRVACSGRKLPRVSKPRSLFAWVLRGFAFHAAVTSRRLSFRGAGGTDFRPSKSPTHRRQHRQAAGVAAAPARGLALGEHFGGDGAGIYKRPAS